MVSGSPLQTGVYTLLVNIHPSIFIKEEMFQTVFGLWMCLTTHVRSFPLPFELFMGSQMELGPIVLLPKRFVSMET